MSDRALTDMGRIVNVDPYGSTRGQGLPPGWQWLDTAQIDRGLSWIVRDLDRRIAALEGRINA